mmetsp:Transcript_5524/g.8355  ORF Transcript_5524/g.8355 Transcript_5524/m.8355 type:complete len:92 (+) Transcript_5524:286-561(+)
MVDEHNTSKTSPCCDETYGNRECEKNKDFWVGAQLIDRYGKQRYRCDKCKRPWHRDLGACLKMEKIFTFQQDAAEEARAEQFEGSRLEAGR